MNNDEKPAEKSDWKKLEDGAFDGLKKVLTWGCIGMMAVLGIMAACGKLTIM